MEKKEIVMRRNKMVECSILSTIQYCSKHKSFSSLTITRNETVQKKSIMYIKSKVVN